MKIIRYVGFSCVLLLCPVLSQAEQGVGLQQYLQAVQASHPYMSQQSAGVDIARQDRQRYLGNEDWVLKASPVYQHESRDSAQLLSPSDQDYFSLNAGAERLFWSNGGRLSVDYEYNRLSQSYAQPFGDVDAHSNGVSVTYMLPLMQNKGGLLDRLQYELAGFDIDINSLLALEQQETFLQQQGSLYIDWVLVTEQRRIADNRLALAQEELKRTENKRRTRLVAEVDVLRARDAVVTAQQQLQAISGQWLAIRAELATVAHQDLTTPAFDLYEQVPVPAMEQVEQLLERQSRQLRAFGLQVEQLQLAQQGMDNQLDPQLDLIAGAGLRGDSDHLTGSTKFDQPQYMVGVNFRMPLGHRQTHSDIAKNRLQQQQLSYARAAIKRDLQAALMNVLVQWRELEHTMELNRQQIEIARLRTDEELKRHEQGRSELSFVIQSRDSEQRAQLAYAGNAAMYQKLRLNYAALTDELLRTVNDEEVK